VTVAKVMQPHQQRDRRTGGRRRRRYRARHRGSTQGDPL